MVRPTITKVDFVDLRCGYGFEGTDEIMPIRNLNFSVAPGNIYLVQGDNGSGKSTLLKALISEVPKLEGTARIHWDGIEDIQPIPISQFPDQVTPIFYMPQRIQGLFPVRTCVGTVLEYWAMLGGKYLSKQERQSLFDELKVSPLIDTVKWRHCEFLSGGQAQLLALILMFLSNSNLALLDEPSSAVSSNNKPIVKDFITKYANHNDEKKTILVATHDKVMNDISNNVVQL